MDRVVSCEQEQLTWPETASAEVKDIIEKLLCPDVTARLGFQDLRANFAHNVCEGIKRHPFFAGTSWEATKIGSFAVRPLLFECVDRWSKLIDVTMSCAQAPLEADAAGQFKQITANGAGQDLNIGTPYSGDFEWLTGF